MEIPRTKGRHFYFYDDIGCLLSTFSLDLFMLHSSELMAGGSPTFRTKDDIERLFCDLETLFGVVHETFSQVERGTDILMLPVAELVAAGMVQIESAWDS